MTGENNSCETSQMDAWLTFEECFGNLTLEGSRSIKVGPSTLLRQNSNCKQASLWLLKLFKVSSSYPVILLPRAVAITPK